MSHPYPGPYTPTTDSPQVQRPPTVTWAVFIMLGIVAGTIASAVIGSFFIVDATEEIATLPDGLREIGSGIFAIVVVIAVIMMLFTVGLWLFMAHFIWRGRNWARITGTVLFGWHTAGQLQSVITQIIDEPDPLFLNVVSAVTWLAALAVVILIWHPASSAYFKQDQPQFLPHYGHRQPWGTAPYPGHALPANPQTPPPWHTFNAPH